MPPFLQFVIRRFLSVPFSLLDPKLLPPPRLELIHRVADEAIALGMPAYLVGGFVRDLLLKRPVQDFDIVVEGDAIALAKALARKYGGGVTAHSKFGTAKWYLPDSSAAPNSQFPISGSLDLITARSETYEHPAALPSVMPGSIADDLRRRDFTVNALALRLDGEHFGEVLDPLGGLADLGRGLIRVLHSRSFVDDPTRMFRAVRYEGRYGFQIAPETLALIPEARPLIAKLSAQRVRRELDLILDEPLPAPILARLDELDLLRPIHPALPWDKSIQARLEGSLEVLSEFEPISMPGNLPWQRALGWLLWLMSLPADEIESLNKRLHFPAALTRSLLAASSIFADLASFANLRPSQVVERLEDLPLLAVYAVYLTALQSKSRRALQSYLEKWRHVKPKATGADLKRRGLIPGPIYQDILQRLRNAWLNSEVTSVTEETALLEKLLADL